MVLSNLAFAQSASLLIGARSTALGNSSACLKDEWALFNNIGGLSYAKHLSANVSYDLHPKLNSFNRAAFVLSTPVKKGVLATGLFRFGDELYNEQVISLGFSNKFGIASLGLKANYIQYSAEGFGTDGFLTVSFGGITELTPKFSVGAHITNINQPRVSDSSKESIPTRVALGVAFLPSDAFLLIAELEKDLDRELKVKSGIEYQFRKKFFFRTGFNIHPDAAFIGTGFKVRKLTVDYSAKYNLLAGMSHQASIGYQLKSK